MTTSAPGRTEPREERAEAQISEVSSTAVAGDKRREHARFRVDLDVSIGSEHNFYAGFAENLSAGGVFVATHLLKPVGEKLEMCVNLPDGLGTVVGEGEVRWLREYNESSDTPPGMGIRFIHFEAGSLEAIDRFLKAREPLFFDDD
jgi:uncharacterized protein (TIGR02266 family)